MIKDGEQVRLKWDAESPVLFSFMEDYAGTVATRKGSPSDGNGNVNVVMADGEEYFWPLSAMEPV